MAGAGVATGGVLCARGAAGELSKPGCTLRCAALWNVLLVQPVRVGRAGGKQGGKQEGGWKKYAHHRQAGMNKPA